MGWERRGERRYYTRSRKVNGRVIREYVGGGLTGLLAEREDEERRQRRAEAKAQLHLEHVTLAAAMAPHQALSRITDGVLAAALVAAGYHRHDRTWRKRRVEER